MTAPTAPIHIAETDRDILRCVPVLLELRPHVAPENFVAAIRRLQIGGYLLAMLETGDGVAAVAGYRFSENLARGKFLYVDDFVTHSRLRFQGHGQKLFAWLVKMATLSGCHELHLDSGVQREGAHRFYEQQKMIFASRHYSLKLQPAC